MENSKKIKKIFFLFIILLIIPLLILSGFKIFSFVEKQQFKKNFYNITKKAELLISTGFSEEAESLLYPLKGVAVDSNDFLKLLKIYHDLSLTTKNYDSFIEVAERSLKRYPGREDLRALWIWGELKSGHFQKARQISEGLTNPVYQGLKTEVLLRYQFFISSFSNPESADAFLYTAEKSKSEIYFLDALLLFLKEGDYRQAGSIYRHYLKDKYPVLGMYLSLDSGRLETAKELLALLEINGLSDELEILYGDIYIRQGEYKKASAFYFNYLKNTPRASWIPYYNYGLTEDENIDSVLSVLHSGITIFPENNELPLLYADVLLSEGKVYEASIVLEEVIDYGISDIRTEIGLMNILEKERSPEFIRGRYWQLLDKYPGESLHYHRFARYLCSWSFWDDFDLLLKRYQKNKGISWELLLWRGIGEALRNDLAAAENSFETALTYEDKYSVLFNLGVVYEYSGKLKQAEALYLKILESKNDKMDNTIKTRVLVHLGIVYYRNKEYKKARIFLDQGLQIIPDDLEGLYYQKLLAMKEEI